MKRFGLLEWVADGFTFLLLTGSLAHTLFISLYMSIPFYKTLAVSLLFFLVLSFIFMWPIIFFLAAGTVPLALWLFKIPLPVDWFSTVVEFLQWAIFYPLGLAPFDEVYVKPFVFLAIGLFSIILYIFTIRLRSLLLPLIFGVVLIGTEWYLGHTYITSYVWIFAFSIILVMANKRYIKLSKTTQLPGQGLWIMWTIPLAIITVISATILTPTDTADLKWEALENLVEDFRENRIGDSSFTRPRQPFRLSSTGFTGPDGELGGPVQLNRDIVLEIKAPFPTYLRGSILNYYTGSSWKDTIQDYRYQFSNKRWSEYRTRAFDWDEALWQNTDNLDAYIKEGLLTPYEITIKHVGIKTSVLFNVQFTENINPQKRNSFKPYFNTKSETFTSRNLNAQDLYIIEGIVAKTYDPEFANLIDQHSKIKENSPKEEYIKENYTQLPDSLPNRVVDLAFSIVEDAHSPYDMVIRIQDYLRENYSYTLNTPHTPPDRDFVDYFLFDLEEGYCTYFASAMAVMLRSVGVPARYIEGFSMSSHSYGHSSYIYNVRNSDAHAWVEVYFPNIGWLTFDPTPGSQQSTTNQELNRSSNYEDYINDYLMDYPPYYELPQLNDIYLPNQDLSHKDNDNKILVIIIIIVCLIGLIIFILGLLVFLWYRSTRIKPKNYTNGEKVMFYYSQILWLLRLYGFPPLPGETPYAYAKRVDSWLINKDTDMTSVTKVLVEYQYASIEPKEDQIKVIEKLYRDMEMDIIDILGIHLFMFEYVKKVLSPF
ncbi:MAG: transglutaminase domain-containing protein [Caldicoprobacterales bacterium]|jgi:hypothetical protein|nr:transglutaminase domain-containing protein [Clostridiales bacterium]